MWKDKMSQFLSILYKKDIKCKPEIIDPNYFVFYEDGIEGKWKFSFDKKNYVFIVNDMVVPNRYRSAGFISLLLNFIKDTLLGVTRIRFICNINESLYTHLKSIGFIDMDSNTAQDCIEHTRSLPIFDGAFPDLELRIRRGD